MRHDPDKSLQVTVVAPSQRKNPSNSFLINSRTCRDMHAIANIVKGAKKKLPTVPTTILPVEQPFSAKGSPQ